MCALFLKVKELLNLYKHEKDKFLKIRDVLISNFGCTLNIWHKDTTNTANSASLIVINQRNTKYSVKISYLTRKKITANHPNLTNIRFLINPLRMYQYFYISISI